MQESENHSCKSCQNTFTGSYCNQCGQKVISRFDLKYLWSLIHDEFLEVDRGFWHTLKDLTIKPGQTIKDYLNGNTRKYFNPIKYLLISAAFIYFLVSMEEFFWPSRQSTVFEFESWREKTLSNEHKPFSFGVMEDIANSFLFITKNYLAAYFLLILPFAAFVGQFVFRKLNLTELLITWIYLWAHIMYFFLSISFPLAWIIGNNPFEVGFAIFIVFSLIFMFYFFTSAFRVITEGKWIPTFFKLILSMYGGFFVFYGVAWVILSFVKLFYQK